MALTQENPCEKLILSCTGKGTQNFPKKEKCREKVSFNHTCPSVIIGSLMTGI